jgi:hypothetical protein
MISIDLTIGSLTTAQRNAIQTAAPLIKAYLRRVIRIYKRATPEQREIIKAHNPALANILEVLEEVF